MKTVDLFGEQQKRTVIILKKLLCFLAEGEDFGIEIAPEYKEKLIKGIADTEGDKLKIALIGGFSEGKTSIAAAWCEKYDELRMKISQQESSDQVSVYSLDEFDLIDTPGLFGFKETAEKEKYKSITNKYVSNAHLVLYVMNPNNPIKESHKEELQWLFKELNLLPRTVFVLSRFDEEVDIEDEEDYQKGLKIKRDNIFNRLIDFDILSDNRSDASIVAVSANPFGKGIDYWLSNPLEYKALSRIDTLQQETARKIETSGGYQSLVAATQKSIISDVIGVQLPAAIARDNQIKEEYEHFEKVYIESKESLDLLGKKVKDSRTELREFVVDFYTDLILQAQKTDENTYNEFFQLSIGNDGVVLNANLQSEIERHLDSVNHEIIQTELKVNNEIQQYNNVIGKLVGDFALKGIKGGGKYLASGGVKLTNKAVLSARDLIAPALKFKPWGAIKLANKINVALPVVGQAFGVVVEVGDIISQEKKKQQFQQVIDDLVKTLEEQRKGLLDLINDETQFAQRFYPDLVELQQSVKNIQTELENKKELHEKFAKWCEQGEAIEVEYQIIG